MHNFSRLLAKSLIHKCSTLFVILLITGCGGGGSDSPPQTDQGPVARAYLNEVITIMRNNAITRNEVDWGNLQAEVDQRAAGATRISDTYNAITRALQLINTNHSFLQSADGTVITYPSNVTCQQGFQINQPTQADIGYIRVDAVTAPNNAEGQQIAIDIQNRIANADSPEVTRWIVDLRNNQGGNMWPMIAGLGPLFEGGLLGYFIDPDETATPWGYRNGNAFLGDGVALSVPNPYTLHNPLPYIAVLVSNRTASSGEATTIAFKKQFNVRFFGTASCGLSTANTPFPLSDGSTLVLTTAVMVDREMERYGGRVSVDEQASPEQALEDAVSWLNAN